MSLLRRLERTVVLTLLLLSTFTLSVAERRERLIDEWRPVHYEVSLTLNEKLSEVSTARAEITAQILRAPIDSLNFDFGEMPIDSINVDGKPARYTQSPGKLKVILTRVVKKGDLIKIAIDYHGLPKDGLILATDSDGRPSATGDNWPDRVHHWIPSLDHPSAKATVRFTVTAPSRDLVVANGSLESTRTNSNSTRTWVWNEGVPISAYCMIVAVGEFARFEARDQSIVPLSYYVSQSDRQIAMQGFASSSPTLKYFSETIGPFPYEKLAMIVGGTQFGGMENSSAIVFSSGLFKDFTNKQPRDRRWNVPDSIRDVVSHEIAHQWFGDSVTQATWADLWLSEGFATYFAALFIEHSAGKNGFRAYMSECAKKYFAYEKQTSTPLHDKDTEDLNALLNSNTYEKGAWVLHVLRGIVGDKAFFQGVRDYYATHRDSTATTEDLRHAMEKASGMDLKVFFTRWVYKSGHPRYDVAWKWRRLGDSNKNGFLELNIRQVQESDAFLDPLIVEITTTEGVQRVTLIPKSKVVAERIPVSSQPKSLVIDPDHYLLKEITYIR